MLGHEDVVATADTAEAISQMRADAGARRLLRLHAVRVETRDDLVDAYHMRNGGAAMYVSGPHTALEEAWREAVCYALKNVRLLKNLGERCVVSIRLGPLCCRVGAEDYCVAGVGMRRCDGGLKSWKEPVLCISQDVPPDGPATAIKELLVENDLALDDQGAEGGNVVGEHLMRSRWDCGKVVTDMCC